MAGCTEDRDVGWVRPALMIYGEMLPVVAVQTLRASAFLAGATLSYEPIDNAAQSVTAWRLAAFPVVVRLAPNLSGARGDHAFLGAVIECPALRLAALNVFAALFAIKQDKNPRSASAERIEERHLDELSFRFGLRS